VQESVLLHSRVDTTDIHFICA